MYLRQVLQAQVQSAPSRLRALPMWQSLALLGQALSERLLRPALRMSVLLAFRVLERLAQSRSRQRPIRQSRVLQVRAQLAPFWQQASQSMGSAVMAARFLLVTKLLPAMRTFTQRVLPVRRRLAPLESLVTTLFRSLSIRLPVVWDRLRRRVRRQLYLRGLLVLEKSPRYWSGER